MRRLTAVIAAFAAALAMCVSACALDENLLGDYRNLLWENAKLSYNEEHGTLSFTDISGEGWVEFPTENAAGVWFYADCGGYSGKSSGSVTVRFLSDDNKVTAEYTKPFVSDGYFYRFQLGAENGYLPVPQNTERVKVIIKSQGDESAYFRNLSLVLSSTAARSDDEEWHSSGKLQAVQVKTTAGHYWFWVVLVTVIPIIMFGLKKLQERAKKVK